MANGSDFSFMVGRKVVKFDKQNARINASSCRWPRILAIWHHTGSSTRNALRIFSLIGIGYFQARARGPQVIICKVPTTRGGTHVMALTIFVKVVGFGEVERHAINTMFRLSQD